ncbi:hypothetical protein [Polaribacter sp. Asnod6-C07]|uniref:hypothetical protein n=1 Tax=Polaribacter sp. Asnod6-C07 TaxID=3160582 RepID=UPI00386B75C3
MKELIDFSSILNNLIAAIIFGISSFSLIYIFRNRLNKRVKNFLITAFKKSIGEKSYKEVEIESTLNEIIESVENTRFFFLRAGNFSLSNSNYNKVVKRLIEELNVWDYHIHLKNPLTGSKGFLNDYFEIKDSQIISVKPISTTELIQIRRNDFNQNCKALFEKYELKQDFIDIIIQGVVQRTEKYPKLKQIDTTKLSITNVTIFYPNSSIKLMDNVVNEFGNALINNINSYYSDSLFIGEDPLKSDNRNAIEFGTTIIE